MALSNNRAGVLVTRRFPSYKDEPGLRYHYPKAKYQREIEKLVDALVLFYEPRRGGTSPTSATGGRTAFTGSAFVDRLWDDPDDPTHGYVGFRYTIDFNTLVPIQETSIQGKSLQSAVKEIPYSEAARIISVGLAVPLMLGSPRQGLTDTDFVTDVAVREIREVILNRAIRDASFRFRVVETVYEGRCALTGIRMTNGNGRAEADAAHIRSVEHGGPDTIRNGLALTKTVHWAFDRGLVSLSNEGRILTVERGLDGPIQRLLPTTGMAFLPHEKDLQPHPAFLEWHRTNVFKG